MGQFQKGSSGNPAGRPPGARNRATLAVEALLEGEAEKLSRKAVDMALEGNAVALRLCLDRIAPPRRGRPVSLDIGAVKTPADLADAQAVVLTAMAAGEMTSEEAADVARVIEAVGSAYERRELESRLAALEAEVRPMTRMLIRRLARLEAVGSKVARPRVVTVRAGETTEQALDRFFDGGEGWPVVVMPEPCRTIEEWQAGCAREESK